MIESVIEGLALPLLSHTHLSTRFSDLPTDTPGFLRGKISLCKG